jgi:hypothetical protein
MMPGFPQKVVEVAEEDSSLLRLIEVRSQDFPNALVVAAV